MSKVSVSSSNLNHRSTCLLLAYLVNRNARFCKYLANLDESCGRTSFDKYTSRIRIPPCTNTPSSVYLHTAATMLRWRSVRLISWKCISMLRLSLSNWYDHFIAFCSSFQQQIRQLTSAWKFWIQPNWEQVCFGLVKLSTYLRILRSICVSVPIQHLGYPLSTWCDKTDERRFNPTSFWTDMAQRFEREVEVCLKLCRAFFLLMFRPSTTCTGCMLVDLVKSEN